jgi:hypothetical protein
VLQQCANSSSTKGKINKHKYGLYLQWRFFITGCLFLRQQVTNRATVMAHWYFTQNIWEFIKILFVFEFFVDLCNLREICVSNIVVHLAGGKEV